MKKILLLTIFVFLLLISNAKAFTADLQIIDDGTEAYIISDLVVDENDPVSSSAGTTLQSGYGSTGNGNILLSYLKYNESVVPAGVDISSAYLWIQISTNNYESGDTRNVSVWGLINQTWNEDLNNVYNHTVVAGKSPPNGYREIIAYNDTFSDTYTGLMGFNITDWFQRSHANNTENISFIINTTTAQSVDDHINFRSKEAGASLSHYINLTYEVESDLISCDVGGNVVLNFTIYDEEDRIQNLTGNLSFAVLTSANTTILNGSFAFTDQGVFEICAYEEGSSFLLDAIVRFNATGYSTRYYYLTNAEINPTTTNNISLYLIDDDIDQDTKFTIKDAFSSPYADVILKIQRFFIDTNEYVQIAMGKSDFVGETVVPLKPNEFYVFILEQNNTILRSFEPKLLTTSDTEIELKTSQTGIFEYYNYIDTLGGSCVFNSTGTGFLRCTATETSGLMTGVTLTVDKVFLNTSYERVCTESGTGTSVLLLCNLSNMTNGSVSYAFKGSFSGTQSSSFLIDAGYLIFDSLVNVWGTFGVFIVLLLVIPTAFVGKWNPSVAVILVIMVLWSGFWMGLLAHTTYIFSGLMSFTVAGVIIVWRLKT